MFGSVEEEIMARPRFAAPKIEMPQVDRHFRVIDEGLIALLMKNKVVDSVALFYKQERTYRAK